jgi:hypothetical protein
MGYVLLRNAVFTPIEERLRSRYRKVTACRSLPQDLVSQDLSNHAKEPMSLQKAGEWALSHVIVSNDKCGSLGNVDIIVKQAVRLCRDVGVL